MTGAASVVALGQLITRQSRVDGAERSRLVALGFRDWQIDVEALFRAALPIVGGVAAGALLAPLASGLFPTGVAGRVEPRPGLRGPRSVLSWRAGRCSPSPSWCGRRRRSIGIAGRAVTVRDSTGAVDALARRCASATAATGLRLAFRRPSRDWARVRAAVLGLMALIAGLAGSMTFSASLDRLVREPVRYGQDFDVLLGSAGSGERRCRTASYASSRRTPTSMRPRSTA